MAKSGKILALLLVVAVWGLGGASCHGKKSETETDPLKAKAREKYAEGRRLFLTCDPNKYDQAQQLFKDALAYWDDYPEALAAWAETMSMWYSFMIPEQLFQQAYSQAQRAVRLDPNLDMGYRAMADLYRHHRDPQTGELQTRYALDVIEMALKINPNSAENLYVEGSIYLPVDQAKAIEILNQARVANPNLGKIYFNLASAYQLMADQMMSQAVKDPSKRPELKDQIDQDLDKAADNLKTYQKLVPGDLSGYCSLGIVYLHAGKLKEAQEQFERTVSETQNADISQNRWKIVAYGKLAETAEVGNNDPAAARTYLERALALAPKNPQTLSELVRLTAKLKDKKAEAEYKARLDEALKEMKEAKEQQGSTVAPRPGSTAAPGPGPLGGATAG